MKTVDMLHMWIFSAICVEKHHAGGPASHLCLPTETAVTARAALNSNKPAHLPPRDIQLPLLRDTVLLELEYRAHG